MFIIQNLLKPNSDAKESLNKKATAWKPLGRLPMWLSKTVEKSRYTNCKKANRYLMYMENRLFKLHSEKKYELIVIIWAILLKRSRSYQMCIFHRTRKDWYWKLSEKQAVKSLKSFMNKCRIWDMKLELERFYLSKPDSIRLPKDHVFGENEKFRPIGSPTYESRMVSKALNDLAYFVLHDDLSTFQHAYRIGRGVHTALIEVWLRIVVLKHTNIREFDLKSFFNNVTIDWVIQYLYTKSKLLAIWVRQIYTLLEYKFERDVRTLPREAEMRMISGPIIRKKKVKKKWKTISKMMFRRKGLPQGLSVSPILATAVLKFLPKLEGLVMFADDGLIIKEKGEDGADIDYWMECLAQMGIMIEPSKSGSVGDNFKFLGIEFDLKEEEVRYKDSKYSWKGKNTNSFAVAQEIYQWFKLVGQYYGKKTRRLNMKYSSTINYNKIWTEFTVQEIDRERKKLHRRRTGFNVKNARSQHV